MSRSRRLLPMMALLTVAVAGCSGAGNVTASTVTPSAPPSATSEPAPTGTGTGTGTAGSELTETAQAQPAADTSDDSIPVPARASSGTVDVDDYAIDEFDSAFAFVSPTGNIGCSFFPGGSAIGEVGCQAGDSVNPVDGRTCTDAGNDKFAVRVNDGGAQHLCTTQGIYYGNGNSKTLPYGQTIVRGDVSCTSEEQSGITCYTDDGGFTLSRNINRTY